MALLLVTGSAFLALWKPPTHAVKIELLPFTNTPPAWDGSYPYVVISPSVISPIVPGTRPIEFMSSILLVKPTVRHDSPLNQFEVDLHSGMFVMRQTDLFVPDITPLSLTRTYRVWDCCARAFGIGMNHPYDI
jgi:hypothetical protein